MEPLLCIMKISDESNEGEGINDKDENYQGNNLTHHAGFEGSS